jgi:hypothetical protein
VTAADIKRLRRMLNERGFYARFVCSRKVPTFSGARSR